MHRKEYKNSVRMPSYDLFRLVIQYITVDLYNETMSSAQRH